MLVKWSEDQVHSECSPSEVARHLSEVNEVILEVVRQVIQYRQQKAEIFQSNTQLEVGLCEYLPWTASVGPGGLREALLKQVLNFKRGFYQPLFHVCQLFFVTGISYLTHPLFTAIFNIEIWSKECWRPKA